MRKNIILILTLLTGLSLARCAKSTDRIDTGVLVRLAVVSASGPQGDGRDTAYTDRWDAFYFYADTLLYHTPSPQDVLARRLRPRDPALPEIAPDGAAQVLADTAVRFDHLTRDAVLVIAGPDEEIYAWRPIGFAFGGLSELQLTLYFRAWAETVYTENKWTVVPKPKTP
jgi:hypothetical protein